MENIIENNKLIAEFMGWERSKYENTPDKMYRTHALEEQAKHISLFYYHNDWSWLMPVVENINMVDGDEFGVTIRGNITDIESCYASYDMYIEERSGSMIENTYKACVRFINWYNQHLKLKQ